MSTSFPMGARWSRLPADSPNPAVAHLDLHRTDDALPGEVEGALRRRLGLRSEPRERHWLDWGLPAMVTLLALVLRLVNLTHPSRLVFDETYYVKQATSMLLLGYEGEWPDDYDPTYATGDFSGLSETADYVVHPPLGKWIIAAGQALFGSDNGVGWRISGAVFGAVGVLLITLLATRLFRSRVLGAAAGVLLAIDGVHLVLSRTGLLDIFLSTLILAGLVLVLLDQRSARARLARRVTADILDHDLDERRKGEGRPSDPWGPRLGARWWLVAAGVVLGASMAVKWSGIYALAAFEILAFVLDAQARRAVGARLWLGGGIMRGGLPEFVALVPVAFVTYVAGWATWFASPNSYLRQWASEQRAAGTDLPLEWLGGTGDAIVSWLHYHRQMMEFHTGLDSEHSYMSHPIGWLVQWRPTSFYWPDPLPEDAVCEAERCIQAITSLGNPLIWWLGVVGLVAVLWAAIARRDVRTWPILAGYAGTYLPWFLYTDRTIFTFYTVAIVPYVVLALTFALGRLLGWIEGPRAAIGRPGGRRARVRAEATPAAIAWLRRHRMPVLAGVLVACAAVSAFYWPIWTGMTVPYEFWRLHMWLPSWV